MKTRFLMLAMMICFVSNEAYAYDIEVENDDGVTLYYNYINGGNELEVTYLSSYYEYNSAAYKGSVVIPEAVTLMNQARKVTSIGNYAFAGCSGLTSVTIPNGVTNIGYNAFYNCTGLTSVTIPNSVTSIGDSAFSGCSGLTSVTIPNSVTSIGEWVFYGCTSLTYISIPYNVTTIEAGTFAGCTSLTSVTIPNNVTSIGCDAFYKCTGLTSINIPNSVTSIGERAFYGCSGLSSIIIPNSVTSIGVDAFADTPWLTSFPDGVVYIGKIAYKYKGTMASEMSITIKDGTTLISGKAFYNCKNLISVIIPNSVMSIGYGAFANCSSLASVTLPESDIEIADDAFTDTPWLNSQINDQAGGLFYLGTTAYRYRGTMPENTNIVLKDGTTSIAPGAFSGCTGLTSITIPTSVNSVSRDAFSNCTGLEAVYIFDIAQWCKLYWGSHNPCDFDYAGGANPLTYAQHLYLNGEEVKDLIIPEGVEYISGGAFYGWKGLTSVSFPSSLKLISGYAFSGCKGLTSLIIPENVERIGNFNMYDSFCSEYGFSDCENIKTVTINAKDLSEIYLGLYSPYDLIIGKSVEKIPESFHDIFGNVSSLIVDEQNTTFDSRNNCNAIIETASNTLVVGSNITVIPNSVKSIGNYAFYNCSGLTSINIPDGVTHIGNNAFQRCTELESVTIGRGLTTWGDNIFQDCNKIKKVTINSNECGSWFAYKSLNEVSLGDNVKNIGDNAFRNCRELSSIIIPNGVTTIGSNAFYTCYGLTSVTIGNGVKSIGNYAFTSCSNLTSVTIPNSVTIIGNSAFSGCSGLTSVTIGNSVTSIGGEAFYYCSSLTSVTIPNSVTSIGSGAFYGCSSLTSVTIPNSVTSIGSGAFYGCSSLTSVIIPNSVTSIGERAFFNCTDLSSVTSYMDTPPILNADVFPATFKTSGTLYIPAGMRNIYVEKGWSLYFANIVEMESGEEIWLSIVDAEQGRTQLKCEPGKSYTFRFEAFEGWHVHSVTYRGSDVTDWLNEDGGFTTPAMSTSTSLIVTYEEGANSVKPIADESPIRVTTLAKDIIVKNAPAGTPITIYDLSGRLLTTGKANEMETRIEVGSGTDVVIVKVGEKTVKVAR